MNQIGKPELLAYIRSHKLAVVATVNRDSAPEAALVGVAITDQFELVFDTISTTRKHKNLLFDPRIAITFSGPEEQTLQYEGVAFPISTTDPAAAVYREAYWAVWPDGRARASWPGLIYWGVKPSWARFSDFSRGPLIVEFHWPGD